MKKIFYIAKKEFASYFRSPIAYVLLVITISVFNVFFFMIIDQNNEATLRDVFKVMEFMFIFIIPMLTMKVFAEERMSGTLEFLMTTPTRNIQIVLGKYFGALILFSIILLLTSVYFLILEIYSQPDTIATALGYFGTWLEGAFFIAVGVLTSSWSRYQVLSAISSYTILLFLYISLFFTKYLSGTSEMLISNISIVGHSENFFVGVLSMSDIVYFLSCTMICLFLTTVSVKNRM